MPLVAQALKGACDNDLNAALKGSLLHAILAAARAAPFEAKHMQKGRPKAARNRVRRRTYGVATPAGACGAGVPAAVAAAASFKMR